MASLRRTVMPASGCSPGCARPRDRLGSVPPNIIPQDRPAMTPSRRAGATARKSPSSDPTAAVERPVAAGVNAPMFGSDVAADALRALDIPYIALNPGASFRGLHDSLVNYLG